MKKIFLILMIGLLLPVSSVFAMGKEDAEELLYDLYRTITIEITVTNNTSNTIIGAYARNSGDSEWGKNILTSSISSKSEGTLFFYDSKLRDILFIDNNGNKYTFEKIVIENVKSISISNSDKDSVLKSMKNGVKNMLSL